MRELVFVVADVAMQQMLEGFFRRPGFHRTLGCAPFPIDPRQNRDAFVAAGRNDPGLYADADQLLRPHCRTHRRAIVMLDAEWDGSPGAAAIVQDVAALGARVWSPDDLAVIVPDPEIEAWLWQPDNPNLKSAMNYRGEIPYREVLAHAGLWPDDRLKPPRPKEAFEYMRSAHHTDFSTAVHRRVGERVSVQACRDGAFRALRDTLRTWFPERP